MADEVPQNAVWYSGFDADTTAALQGRGWDKLEPAAAVAEAVKAWREAQKMVGVPREDILRLSHFRSDDPAVRKAAWSAVGAKGEPAEYDLSGVKRADGTGIDEKLGNTVKAAAARLHMPADMLAGLMGDIVKHADTELQTKAADMQLAHTVSKGKLEQEWGAALAGNQFVAGRAAAAAGFTPAMIDSMEKADYYGTWKMLHNLGQRMGEARFVEGGNVPNAEAGLNPAQAALRLQELKMDPDWRAGFLKGPSSPQYKQAQLLAERMAQGA